jgi:hypothetical protein
MRALKVTKPGFELLFRFGSRAEKLATRIRFPLAPIADMASNVYESTPTL